MCSALSLDNGKQLEVEWIILRIMNRSVGHAAMMSIKCVLFYRFYVFIFNQIYNTELLCLLLRVKCVQLCVLSVKYIYLTVGSILEAQLCLFSVKMYSCVYFMSKCTAVYFLSKCTAVFILCQIYIMYSCVYLLSKCTDVSIFCQNVQIVFTSCQNVWLCLFSVKYVQMSLFSVKCVQLHMQLHMQLPCRLCVLQKRDLALLE